MPIQRSCHRDKNERKTLEEVKPNHERGRPDEAPPAFKYAHSPVRNRLARKQLKGFDCVECKRFYEASTGLTERQRQELMQKCSRHRGRFSPPPNSPQEIWEVNMDRYQVRMSFLHPRCAGQFHKYSLVKRESTVAWCCTNWCYFGSNC